MTEPPEFHSNIKSPVSPTPLHPPEPSNIPVLQHQIDPVFNMTSTHIDPPQPAVTAPAEAAADPVASPAVVDSPTDSSFSDAYKEEGGAKEKGQEPSANQEDVSDDYAMTFDTDGEEQSDSQDLSRENIQHPPSDLPDGPHATNTSSSGPDTKPPQSYPIPSNLEAVEAAAAAATLPQPGPPHTGLEPTIPSASTREDVASGEIDIQQLLDNITANAEMKETGSALNTPTTANPPNASIPKAGSSLPPHSSLPPRPQVPSSNQGDDMTRYHAGTTNFPQPQTTYKPGVNVPLVAAGAPGTYTDPRNGLPPPPTASFRQPPPSAGSPISPGAPPQLVRFGDRPEAPEDMGDSDIRWGPDIQRKFDQFLTEERGYVTDGQWDRFPVGSRLFIGNLPSDKVTKRDIFHVFHKYGRLAQIAIKQAYGFVQFHDSAACYEALAREQGSEVRGRKMHLEISKPQKNTRNAQPSGQRRSRSPEYNRGGGRQGRGHERYDSRGSAPARDEYGRTMRGRDDYRPGRSPSPVLMPFDGRDAYGPSRGRDSYDRRDRRRSRSRSPYNQRDSRYRERPSSAGRREEEDSELQIPRRDPRNIPDIQIILMDQLDRGFVNWVEGELSARGLKSEVMFLSPRLSLEVVVRRQILEGVLAISQLDMRAQNSSKIALQVFDRRGGVDNVRFDEYQDLEPRIAAELILRAKATSVPQVPQGQVPYGAGYGAGQPQQPPAAQAVTPNLANLVGQLDNATLQKLLGSLSAPVQQNAPVATAGPPLDLAGLLGGLKHQQQQQPYSQAPGPDPYSNLANNPAIASLLGNAASQQQAQQPQQSAQQVQNIMAQLARFRQ